jgi:ABC-type bacteriocin/lantibiotic exporter with double-glycine peptidase domain
MLALQFRMIQPILHGEPQPRRAQAVLAPLQGHIELAHVSCRLSVDGPLVLDDISLTIAPGEHIGIAGPSGAGKSTLVRTMLGLIRRETGHVMFDGCDIGEMDAAAVRRQIGVIGQGGRLFPGTLLDNIAAGAAITPEQAMKAARLAGFEQDVAALPLGLATPIGDAECGFSGGQVQRILLARAFATRSNILVLDEATSALDPQLQAHVARAIDDMKATTISIAHRLDTLRECDRIYVLDAGRIVETGTYASLAASGGLFCSMREAEKAPATEAQNAVHAAFCAVEAAFA